MTLVVGATGLVGAAVVERLIAAGKPVRALVRPGADPAKVARLRQSGAAIVEGDLKDPASLRRACDGATTVVSTASAMISRGDGDSIDTVDRDGQIALVDAARAGGAAHFIYVSFSGNIDGDFPLRRAKRAVEQRLRDSGMAYTIVRPSFFMEVWLSPRVGFDPAGGTVRIFGSGERPVSPVSAFDVAAYVAGCVDNSAARNQTIELGGPSTLTMNAIVNLFERALGRPVQRQHVPEAGLEGQAASAADPVDQSRAALALALARGDAIDPAPALARVAIPLTPVEDYVRRAAASHST